MSNAALLQRLSCCCRRVRPLASVAVRQCSAVACKRKPPERRCRFSGRLMDRVGQPSGSCSGGSQMCWHLPDIGRQIHITGHGSQRTDKARAITCRIDQDTERQFAVRQPDERLLDAQDSRRRGKTATIYGVRDVHYLLLAGRFEVVESTAWCVGKSDTRSLPLHAVGGMQATSQLNAIPEPGRLRAPLAYLSCPSCPRTSGDITGRS